MCARLHFRFFVYLAEIYPTGVVANSCGVKLQIREVKAQLYVTTLKQFIYWLDAEGLAPNNFNRARCEGKLQASRGKRAPTPYQHRAPDQDLMRIVEHLNQAPTPPPQMRDAPRLTMELLRNRALMHTLLCSGGRISESGPEHPAAGVLRDQVLSLKRSQVQDGRIDEVLITGKGGKQVASKSAISRYCGERQDT